MKPRSAGCAARETSGRLRRLFIIASATLILCSCQTAPDARFGSSMAPGAPPALPREAYSGMPVGAPGMATAPGPGVFGPSYLPPVPSDVTGPWAPPGLPRPWPPNEYLVDGGDFGQTATVQADWEVRGLEPADTIVHYDTLDGQTVVEPSNRVHIYSPRFGAVRKVVSLRQNDQTDRFRNVYQPVRLVQSDDLQIAASSKQHIQAERHTGRYVANVFRTHQGDGLVSQRLGPHGFQNGFQPYEDVSAIRQGMVQGSEMAWLAQGVLAAVTWSHKQAVQIILDQQRAAEEIGDRGIASVWSVDQPPANPKLRVMKVASTQSAAPGEEVDFTIRFDNVGNQVIGNVTVIDNLTTRLQYEPDSAQCSIEANFLTEPSQSDSLVLRWEIAEPLLPGKGGIIRFRCRVR